MVSPVMVPSGQRKPLPALVTPITPCSSSVWSPNLQQPARPQHGRAGGRQAAGVFSRSGFSSLFLGAAWWGWILAGLPGACQGQAEQDLHSPEQPKAPSLAAGDSLPSLGSCSCGWPELSHPYCRRAGQSGSLQ